MASRRIRRTNSFTGFIAAANQDINTSLIRNDVTSISSGVIGGDNFSEEIQVVDKALQSDNYIQSEAGWKIDGSGNAEFANVFVRGDINAQTGTIGYWNISTPSVTRTFGTNTLFGTFLESQNLGASDTGAAGTYVSLFKSYIQPDGALSAIARDADGNAIVTVVGHNYLVGDLVTVTVDDVAGFTTGGTPVRITAITTDTFSYPSAGSAVATTDSTGTVVFVNPDISGLYLRDYTKANFDYGYMSNTGLAYVSAETLNLVYNPSFEFTDINTYEITACTASSTTVATYTVDSTAATNPFVVDQRIDVADVTPSYFNGRFFVTAIGGSSGAWTVTVVGSGFTSAGTGTVFGAITSDTKPSVESWDTSTGGALSRWSFISSALRDYATASSFGGAISWTNTVPTAKFRTTVSYSTGDSYKLFTGDRPLYFEYEAFLNYTPFMSTLSSVSATSTVVTITTAAAHGLQAGNIVYLDFTAIDTAVIGFSTFTENVDFALNTVRNSKVFEVKTVTSATVFTVDNKTGYGAPVSGPVLGYRSNRDGSIRATRNIYKVVWPAIDLSEVSFVFPNASTTTLYSVLDSATKALWDASANYKYKTLDPDKWMLEYLDPVDGISPVLGNEIIIDGSALRDVYSSSDNASFLTKADIKVLLPIKMYAQAYADATATDYLDNPTPIYTSTTGAVHTSTASISLYGGNGTVMTYTAANNFVAGDRVTVTGSSIAGYNVTNAVINTASSTSFTVLGATTGVTGGGTATSHKTLSTVIDEVSISTEPIAFYGDTSDSYYWKDNTLNSPSQVSVQGPKKWIDIDLATQTGTIGNLDYIGFKPSHLSHTLSSKPSVSTVYTEDSGLFGNFNISDYEQLKTSSGVLSKANVDDTSFVNFEGYSRSVTSDVGAISEIAAESYGIVASVTAYSEYSNTRVVLSADAIHVDGNLRLTNVYPEGPGGYRGDPAGTRGTIYFYGNSAFQQYITVAQTVDATGTITGGNLTTGGSITRTLLNGGGTTGASINNTGAIVRTSSSERYKQDIQSANFIYEDILLLSPKTFRVKEEVKSDPQARIYAGLIAEEVDQIESLRVFVNYLKQEDNSIVPDGIAYGEMVSALVSAIKHQDGLIKSLESRLSALEGE